MAALKNSRLACHDTLPRMEPAWPDEQRQGPVGRPQAR